MMKSRPVILGLGNPLFSDEGLGIHLVHQLMLEEIASRVVLVDGGTDALSLLGIVEDAEHLLVIDAVDGDEPAGSLYSLQGGDISLRLSGRISAHQIDFQEVLALAGLRGRLPAHLVLMGVQPQSLDWGTELTSKVAGAMPRLHEAIYEQIANWT